MEYYLKHHGIKGQQWGKKNGPPYPLDAEDHSAAEKKSLKSYISNKVQEHKEYKNKLKTAKNEYYTRRDSTARLERAKNFALGTNKSTIKRMAKYGESIQEAGKKSRKKAIVKSSAALVGYKIVNRFAPEIFAFTISAVTASYMYNKHKKRGTLLTQNHKYDPIDSSYTIKDE